MGTGFLIFIQDESGEIVVTLCGQYDGNPSCVGNELVEFLRSRTVGLVNGIRNEEDPCFNGMPDLACQCVCHLKHWVDKMKNPQGELGDGKILAGGLYVQPSPKISQTELQEGPSNATILRTNASVSALCLLSAPPTLPPLPLVHLVCPIPRLLLCYSRACLPACLSLSFLCFCV